MGLPARQALEPSNLDDVENGVTQLEKLCRDLDEIGAAGKAVLEACIRQAKIRKTIEACTEEAA